MKKKYKICIFFWLVEFAVIYVLDKADIHFSSLIFHAISALLCMLPIVILFVLLSKDEGFSVKKRMAFKVIYIYIVLCYVGGLMARILL